MPPLYLDTARLGLMTPSARSVYRDFVEFVAEAGLSLYAEEVFWNGDFTAEHRERFPALAHWDGIEGLKRLLRSLVSSPPALPLLLASRSTALMQLGARVLFRLCGNVLTSDLAWPAYLNVIQREAARTGGRVTVLKLRDAVFQDGISEADVIDLVKRTVERRRCDGLFLPAVSHDGVQLPVRKIAQHTRRFRFVVIDGAQTLGHMPISLSDDWCDFFIAGCHKWLGAYHPLGLGFCGRVRAAGPIMRAAEQLQRAGIADPLLSLLNTEHCVRFGETVNVGPLFSCQGALADVASSRGMMSVLSFAEELPDELIACVHAAGWSVRNAHPSLRSRIVLGICNRRSCAPPESLRDELISKGVAATVYPGGVVRLSMRFGREWLERRHLIKALRAVA